MTLYICPETTRKLSSGSSIGFIGGRPELPSGAMPSCELCGARQTFYFQIRFPSGHAWCGQTLAVFACTSCANDAYLVPEMLDALPGADVSAQFLESYERNFRFLVFPTSAEVPVVGHEARLERTELYCVSATKTPAGAIGKLQDPHWVLENEAPTSVGGVPAHFLLQLYAELEFGTVSTAPPQRELDLSGCQADALPGRYELFLANELYFYGGAPESGQVYVFTQVD
jgi:hypothetical protein